MPKQISISTQLPELPRFLALVLTGPRGAIEQFRDVQQTLPTLSTLGTGAPTLTIPGLGPDLTSLLRGATTYAAQGTPTQQAIQSLLSLVTGPLGSSSLVQETMRNVQEFVDPVVRQQAALQGLSTSGAALDALSRARSQALLPALETELRHRQQAAQALPSLAQARLGELVSAFELAGIPRQIAVQRAQAAYQKAVQDYRTQLELQSIPLRLLGSLIGRTQRTTAQPTVTADDWLGVGISLAPDIIKTAGQILGFGG